MSEQLERELEGGRVVLGGCIVGPLDPDLHCNACGHEWDGRASREPVLGATYSAAPEPVILGPRFEAAVALAAEVHRTQRRKGTRIPYISHPLAVAALVIEAAGSEDVVIAALLHDAVEDGGGMPVADRIGAEFGAEVRRIVLGCSDSVVEDPTRKEEWRARKVRHLAELAGADRSVALVTTADKLHNARSVAFDLRSEGEALWSRFQEGRAGTLWHYGEALKVLRANPNAPAALVEQFARTVDEVRDLAGD
jgi:(p)ppGpp synthase/HD superfamily hydrolase